MKTNMMLVVLIVFLSNLLPYGCTDNNDIITQEGKIVFYTNAQAILNCGSFNVNIYIDNELVGKLHEPYLDIQKPECNNSTTTTLVLEVKVGEHKFHTSMDCQNSNNWSSVIDVYRDSCTYVYLDALDFIPENN